MIRAIKRITALVLITMMTISAALTAIAGATKKSAINVITSSTNGVSIYVSKMNNTLTLSQNGSVIGTYEASLGQFSQDGNKVQEGDRRTPNGKYYVCTRNDKSSYHLALGVSYPGIDDAERGLEQGIISQDEYDAIVSAVRAGQQPPWDTALGGYIEIHGNRKAGGNTAGCIALDNDIMDILWSYCNLGVPITIGP